MNKVFIVSAKRTAVASFLGGLFSISPGVLGGTVIKNIIDETKVDPKNIDEVIIGNVLSAGHTQGIGRQSAVLGGVPIEVPAHSLNMICGSGLKSVMNAYTSIKAGEANLILAGGTESMSQAPYLLPHTNRTGNKMGEMKVKDHMILDALTDAFNNVHMGITAENIAERYGISREEQDSFAYYSQQKAINAIDSGRFKDEIVPVEIKLKKETVLFDTDEYPNRKTSFEKLAGLRPAFKKDGSVTAGNASGLNDGAAILLLASEEALTKYNLTPIAEVVGIGQGGVDPLVMGLGPVPAIRSALEKSNLKLSDMDILELNEAFAAQSLGVIAELTCEHGVEKDWILNRTNFNGGAIAIGHPVGASGARILVTLLHEMKKQKLNYGLASLCIGGGMGTAVIVKLV